MKHKIKEKIENGEIIVACMGHIDLEGVVNKCDKVRVEEVWIQFDHKGYDKVSHGLCPDCYQVWIRYSYGRKI